MSIWFTSLLGRVRNFPLKNLQKVLSSQASGSNKKPLSTAAPLPDDSSLYEDAHIDLDSLQNRWATSSTPLSQPLHKLPEATYNTGITIDKAYASTRLSTLENGLRVATMPHYGEYCTVGVVIDAGPRYEVEYPSGVSHFVEKLAFNSMLNYVSRDHVFEVLEQNGGICDCQATRDTFLYAASCHVGGVDPVMRLIGDAVLRPRFDAEHVEMARNMIEFELDDMNRDLNPERLLADWIHSAAYRHNTLGLPKYCPPENLQQISRELLYGFISTYFRPERMVVAGVGVDHDVLCDVVRRYFVKARPIWEDSSYVNLVNSNLAEIDRSVSQFTGGDVRVSRNLNQDAHGPSPLPELAHFVLGLESCSYKDADFVPFCVLNSLMGGGGSFSAGGPGKGMYTRLYLNVLNAHHWMFSATAFNHVYSDSGVFCIHASSEPPRLGDVARVIVEEFLRMAGEIGVEEFDRAKAQLQSLLMLNLEQRPVLFEDLGRQVLGHGHRKSPAQYRQEIQAVQVKDLHRVTNRLLKSKAAVVGYGQIDKLPVYKKIDQAIAHADPSLLKSAKLFSF